MVTLGLGNAILPNLVQQRFIADLQHGCRLLAIPVCLLQRLGDGLRFGFVFRRAGQ